MRKRSAFTITELIIVVIIIGVLAAVALPSYRIQMLKMKNQEAIRILMVVWEAQKEYYRENGSYYPCGGTCTTEEMNNALAIEIPPVDPIKDFWSKPTGWGGITCASGPEVGLSAMLSKEAYGLIVLEDGRIVCSGFTACSYPLCQKMGFPDW